MQPSKKKLLQNGLKLLIAILLAWAIYYQVFAHENLENLVVSFSRHFQMPDLLWLLAACLLVFPNYLFENLKFRQLIRTFSDFSFMATFKSVVAGTTIAIFTPNRVGEYGGRVLFFRPEQGWKVVIATLVGSLSQLLALFTFGIPGAIYFTRKYLESEYIFMPVVLVLGVVFLAMLFFGFFNIDLVIPIARRIRFLHRFKKYLVHLKVLGEYSSAELRKTLAFAMLRYLTYSTQYYLLLQFFGIEVDWLNGMAGVASIFLVQASIPLPPITGLLARSEIALFVWGIFSDEPAKILAATFLLFIINIALPALLGFLMILRVNFSAYFNNEI